MILKKYLQKLDAALRMADLRLGRGRNNLAQASLDVAENYLKLLENSFSDDLYINDIKNKAFINYLSQAQTKYKRLVDTCTSVERSDSPEKLLKDAFNFSESQRQLGLDHYSLFPSQGIEEAPATNAAESPQRLGLGRYGFLARKVEENPAAPASEPGEQRSYF